MSLDESIRDRALAQMRAAIERAELAEAELAALRTPQLAAHPGEHHEFSTTCLRCGKAGYLNVAVITTDEVVRIEPIPEVPT